MGLDPTRYNSNYQKPQEAKDYGKPNTNQMYDVQYAQNNPGVAPTVTPIQPKAGSTAPDPGKGSAYATPKSTAPAPSYGYASGPGILESWFKQRASGTDPGWEYALNRGSDALDTRMAAGGSFNSGARAQGLSDLYANMTSQREGQLDALAAGASGEYQGRINSMFNQGLGLAGGESGINSAYDLASGKAMSDALAAALGFTLNKAGVDNQSQQQGIGNLLKIGGIAAAA